MPLLLPTKGRWRSEVGKATTGCSWERYDLPAATLQLQLTAASGSLKTDMNRAGASLSETPIAEAHPEHPF